MKQASDIGFIGAGKVASALALAFHHGGHRVTAVASRSFPSAQHLASAISGCNLYTSPQSVADTATLVFITTPDESIASVASRIRWSPAHTVVHCSGAATVDALQSAREQGALVGGMHPLHSFASDREPLPSGVTFALEGEARVIEALQALVSDLHGTWFVLQSEDKALYHLGAVLACNYVVSLAGAAVELWQHLGVPEEQARQGLLALLKGTVRNLEQIGLPGALTGPISRGDVATVEKHLQELESRAPDLLTAYRELGRLTIPLGLAKGTLKPEAAQQMLDTLKEKALLATR
jgi:predicted short-subunit dehydrogenase-like oxidoreductase (DUF2520 family)